MKIGIFDSGIGGLTVLEEVKSLLPNETYIYIADRFHVPYGTKTKEEVHGYVEAVASFLDDRGIDVMVVACNTATSISVKKLRKDYNFPVIGMEPAVKPALSMGVEGKILVMATPLTLEEEKYHSLVKKYDHENQVESLEMAKLVGFAEAGDFSSEAVKSYIKSQLQPYDLKQFGAIVLGCTHFIYYKELIECLVPKHIQIVDGNLGTANHLKQVMSGVNTGDTSLEGSVTCYETSNQGLVALDWRFYDKRDKCPSNG